MRSSTFNHKEGLLMKIEGKKILHTDVLIIGGGTAGCYAAMTIREQSDYSIIIAEKANIRRSGCLAAGVNALNAYITKVMFRRITWTTPQKMPTASSGRICF